MRAVVQRVTRASVDVAGEVIAEIGLGLCVLIGVTHLDGPEQARRMADRLWGLRIFADEDGRMNRSVGQVGGSVLVVSQFTLYGDTSRGRRPSWSAAAPGGYAEPLVGAVADGLRSLGAAVATGRFGAVMDVSLVNSGPVTVVVET